MSARDLSERPGERGQVLVLAALMMTVLVSFLALVVDVGHAFAQRRYTQNAADAAAVAGARLLAVSMQSGLSDATVLSTVNSYLSANGGVATISAGSMSQAWFVGPTGTRIRPIATGMVPPVPIGGAPGITGVEIEAGRQFDTFFASVLGYQTMQVRAKAMAQYGGEASQILRPPDGSPVMPIMVSLQTYNQSVNTCGGYGGTRITFTLDIVDPFVCSGATGDAGFNWGPLNITGANSNSVVKELLETTGDYATQRIAIGDLVQVAPGERAVDYRDFDDNWQGQDVVIPLVGSTIGCPNCSVPLVGFAWFHLYRSNGQGAVKYFEGWWVDPRTKPPVVGRQVGSPGATITGPVTFSLWR